MANKLTHDEINRRVLAAMQPPAQARRALPDLAQMRDKAQQLKNGRVKTGEKP